MRCFQFPPRTVRHGGERFRGSVVVSQRKSGNVRSPSLSQFGHPTNASHSTPFSNYEQLGLKFRLFSAEVLFNKGLSQIYMGRTAEGLTDMQEAARDKATDEHNVIDDAIQDRGEGYTVFSIVSLSLLIPRASVIIVLCSLLESFTGRLRRNSRAL